jgi:hypothetical protein
MPRIDAFSAAHLPQLLQLVNLHLTSVIPGWALSEAALARHLERDDSQPVTDPWVAERASLCALEGSRVLAAAHVLRYGTESEIGDAYRGTAEISWFLARPGRSDAAMEVLATVDDQFRRWGIANPRGWGPGLPAGPLWGVPDVWPHVADALEAAGYRPDPAAHREALYGGWLPALAPPASSPVSGLTILQRVETYETRFAVSLDGEEIGHCDVQSDLTRGGQSPRASGLELAHRSSDRPTLAETRNWLVARPARRRMAAPGRLRPGRLGSRG